MKTQLQTKRGFRRFIDGKKRTKSQRVEESRMTEGPCTASSIVGLS